MTPARAEVLAAVAALVVVRRRPVLVVIDGVDGAGKTTFADELAPLLVSRGVPVVRASIDDFHHPRDHRHARGRTAEAVWSRHFDYAALRRELLEPWKAGPPAAYRRRWHDVVTDTYVDAPTEPVPADGILLVDGVFAQRRELADVWDLAVFLDAPSEVTVARMAARDGTDPDPTSEDQARYVDAQRHYLTTCDPRTRADVLIDNTDLDHRLFSGLDNPPGRAPSTGE